MVTNLLALTLLLTGPLVATWTGQSVAVAQERPKPVQVAATVPGENPGDLTREISEPLPFKKGEALVYDVSFSKLIFSGQIGQLKLWVSEEKDPSKSELFEFQAEAVSKGFFTWLFGIKVRDQFKTLVNAKDLGLHTSIKTLEEGDVRVEQKAIIDRQARRVTYSERDLVKTKSTPKIKESESPAWVQDVLSAIYLVRTQRLKEGETITIPISDAAQVYNIELVAGKRGETKVRAGKFKTLEVEAKIFDGRFINKKGQLVLWFSDDERRLPVKARIKTAGTTVTIALTNIK